MTKHIGIAIVDGLATLTLDDPGAEVNTVTPAWIDEMSAVFEALKTNDDVRGVILTSAKAGFMAGADLKYILEESGRMRPEDGFAFSQRATRMHRLVETCGKPVVAAMNGFALGGGYELALACTYRILADEQGASVGLPEVNVGLLPGSGGTQRLPRLIGVEKAADVLLGGKSYPPAEALKLGLVDCVCPAGEVMSAAKGWLDTNPDPTRPWDVKGFAIAQSDGLLKQGTAGYFTFAAAKLRARYADNYPAPISILTCLFEGVQVPFDKGLLVESRHFARLITDPRSRNIIRTTFVARNLAQKGARRPQGIARSTFCRIGILGAGMMGAGIAFVCARAGIDVILLDTSLAAAEKGKAYSEKIVSRQIAGGLTSQDEADAVLARIKPTIAYADLAGVDLVVEAVFEDAGVKADVTAKAQAVIGKDALFASNTSTIPISQLAEAFERPADFIGLHFFSPVDKMALVEIILGRKTRPEALAKAIDFIAKIRKVPIVVNDSRGFYTSRVFQSFIHEGLELLREGVEPALIENGARMAGMPVGPLAVLDEVTLQLPMKIIHETEADDPAFTRPTSMEVLEKMVDQLGRPGRKDGGGFYEYPQGGRKRLWTGLKQAFPTAAEQPSLEDVKRRILYIQAIETARCLEEGVLTEPADGDLGALLGWGYPAWTGGTLSLIDTVGSARFVEECDRLAQACGHRYAPTARLREMAAAGTGFHV